MWLRAGGNLEAIGAAENGHVELRAEGQLRERRRQIGEQVGAVAREDGVLADADEDVEIAGRAAVDAARALSGETQLHAVVDARRDLHGQHPLGAFAPLAAADLARALVQLPFAATAGTRPGHGEKAVAHAHLAASLTRLARGFARAGLGGGAGARFAALQARDLHLRLEAGRGLLERDLQLVLEVLPAHRARAAAAASAAGAGEEVVEDVFEQRAEPTLEAAAGGRARCGAEAVVVRALVGIGENRVGLAELLEALLGLLVTGILVGMELHGQLPVGLLQLGVAGTLVDAENLVIVASHLGGVLVGRGGDGDHRRAQHAAVQQIARRRLVDHGIGRGLGADDAGDGLVTRGIERLSDRGIARDAGPLQHPEQLSLDQLHAGHDTAAAGRRARRVEGPIEVVEHGDQVAHQRLRGVLHVVVAVALRPATDVVRFRQRAQQAVLLVVELAPQVLELRLRRRRRDVVGAGGTVFLWFVHRLDYSSGVTARRARRAGRDPGGRATAPP